MVTTHQQPIKVHAHAHPAMDTAVMDFDVETLLPTFHVRVGYFGGSNALAVGQRLGLPPDLLATAYKHLDADQHRLVEVAERLQVELQALEQARREVERERQSAAQARLDYETKVAEVEAARRLQVAHTADDARRWLADARRRLDDAIHQVRRQGLPPAVEPARAVVRQVEAELGQMIAQTAPADPGVRPLSVGEAVWLPRWRVRGVVLKWPEVGELVEIQAGHVTLKVPASQLEPFSPGEVPPPGPRASAPPARRHSPQDVSPELNLIGWRVADALSHLDHYLDRAVAAGLSRVRIIHGKGSGRLRAAVHELLTSHPQVKAYTPCSPHDGGWGATSVETYA
jgi:DNA mismatch repair protein MutS2